MVVLHLGCIDMKDYTDRLLEMIADGKRESSKFAALCEDVMKIREKKKTEHMDLAGEMLTRLADKAEEHGLRLGIENRQALEEVPLDSDFDLFLREFNRPGVGYWHDCGHAQIKEHLGFISHRMHLENLAPRLIGFHIHDVEYPDRDHRRAQELARWISRRCARWSSRSMSKFSSSARRLPPRRQPSAGINL